MSNVITTRGAQYPLAALFEISVGDTMVDSSGVEKTIGAAGATALNAVHLPPGSVILTGWVVAAEVNDGTSATVSIGDNVSATRYVNALDVSSDAAVAITNSAGYVNTAGNDLLVTITTGDGDATEGSVRLVVVYMVEGRVNEVQTA